MIKFSTKQLDEVVRLFGTLTAAAIGGASIGFARPEQVTPTETLLLVLWAAALFGVTLYLRRETT